MTKNGHILYIQHAPVLGGSVISLKEIIIDAVSRGYKCTVICPNAVVAEIYNQIGVQTYVKLVIPINHNTAYHYKASFWDGLRFVKALLMTCKSFIQLSSIIRKERPDIIHLNSSGLILYVLFFRALKIPSIFHVREYIVSGYFGLRKRLIKFIANRWASHVIFISECEFELLKTDLEKSSIIYNYVHERTFCSELHVSEKIYNSNPSLKLITLGGLFELKGGKTLLESLLYVDAEIELAILGAVDGHKGTSVKSIDGDSYWNDILTLLKQDAVRKRVRLIGKVKNAASYINQADVLIFWAKKPHFPRPVFEAWLLKKAVIYFNPDYSSSKINKSCVYTVDTHTPKALAQAIVSIKQSDLFSEAKVNHAYNVAKAHFTEENFEKVDQLYQNILTNLKT